MLHHIVLKRFVPEGHPQDGDVFIEILLNIRIVDNKPLPPIGHPFTVCVSRRKFHAFKHKCATIEAAQQFVEQHRYDIALINPEGKLRAYHEDAKGSRYYYMGRSYKDTPHWRAEESRAAWLTETEFAAVVEEARTYQYTVGKTIHKSIVV